MEPLYPVDRMVLSRTITAPTNLRAQVDRDATTLAMLMKYSSQEARSGMGFSTKKGPRPDSEANGFGVIVVAT